VSFLAEIEFGAFSDSAIANFFPILTVKIIVKMG